ncbi:MAG: TonB-dependent receptor plug domain-containing protein [Bacteroidia bacterium]
MNKFFARSIFVFLSIINFQFLVYSQQQESTKKITGIVVEIDEKGTINPIFGAVVFWQGTTKSTTTDTLGYFEVEKPTISNKLIILATGFFNDTILIDKQSYLKVLLLSKTKLNETIVEYERKSSEISFIDPLKVTLMTEKELFKAACCNLSESFETNPSVDVSFTDALTGTRQIQMLGLTGQYTQFTQNAMPSVRGIATNFGLNYLPGTWIKEIQVSKGVGSVVNGYEAIAGQINTNLHMPDEDEKVYLNLYSSEGGRNEANIILNNKMNKKLSVGVLCHFSNYALRMDRNNDGFLDNPVGTQLNGQMVFKYDNLKGLLVQGGIRTLTDDKIGGENNFSQSKFDTSANAKYFGTRVNASRTDGWFKTGYVFKQKVYKSIGLQVNASNQKFNNYFGKNFYDANQQNFYANLIYQTIISNTNHKIRLGLSTNNDIYKETLFNYHKYTGDRTESIHGAFTEYTYTFLAKFTLVAGIRLDQFNFYRNDYNVPHQRKYLLTPRFHARYAFNEKTVLRVSVGTGWRPINPVADNAGLLVSSRTWHFDGDRNFLNILPYQRPTSYSGLAFNAERALNAGVNLTHDFKLNYRFGTISAEYYITEFLSQYVVDRDYSPQHILFLNAKNATTASNFQIQLDYSPARRVDVRIAYRNFNVNTNFLNARMQAPLIAKNRAFVNLAYKTKKKWEFDLTTQYIGRKRLPNTQLNPEGLRFNDYSPAYFLVHTQVTKTLKKYFAVYTGVENLLNFKQFNPILDAQNPFSQYFDASMIWGPVFGRMIYAGLRFRM